MGGSAGTNTGDGSPENADIVYSSDAATAAGVRIVFRPRTAMLNVDPAPVVFWLREIEGGLYPPHAILIRGSSFTPRILAQL